ncbi:MAG: 23S rRNA (uracil(1939)-C(5))-methyltransferase RlmD [Acutalibacteraceae bacterium]
MKNNTVNIKKNDILTLSVTGMTAEGNAVCKTEDGMVIFVPMGAVGDLLSVRILKVNKTFAYGKLEKILSPSPHRIAVDCPYFEKCGGCTYRHISYEQELEIKQQRVADAVTRIGGLEDLKINAIVGSEKIEGYRNKAQLPIGKSADGKAVMGYYSYHSHRIIDCERCRLQPEIFGDIMDTVREFIELTGQAVYDEQQHKGRLRHLYIRYGEKTGEIMVCLVVNGNGLKQEELLIKMLKERINGLKSVIINSNREKTNVILGAKNRTAYGADCIEDELCGKTFKISPMSFYQVNRNQAEKLYSIAEKYAQLTGDEVVLDLYCGTGTIGLSIADKCKKLIGVEIVEQAIENAKENAVKNNITNAEFYCASADEASEKLRKQGVSPDVVIVDPPRKGLNSQLIETIVKMSPKRVVYVSCDSATLARDLKEFSRLCYKPKELTPVDMFPRTPHVECVVLMSRAGK